jgi:hypothetical protein
LQKVAYGLGKRGNGKVGRRSIGMPTGGVREGDIAVGAGRKIELVVDRSQGRVVIAQKALGRCQGFFA